MFVELILDIFENPYGAPPDPQSPTVGSVHHVMRSSRPKKTLSWSHKPMSLNGRLGNSEIGGCKEIRQPFANPSPTLRQPSANPSPTFSANPSPTPSFRKSQAPA